VPDSGSAPGEWLTGGRVGRPHGLDGSFHVTRPRPALLELGRVLRVAGRELEIVRRSGTDERPILRLAGVQGREGVEALRGEELMVPRSAAPDLGEDEWWAEELEGCRVTDGDREVGLPSCEALRVERPDPGGGELLVPLVRDAVRSVDMRERRIDVNLAFLGEDEA
jgi:16S rRNA processing protein RimM